MTIAYIAPSGNLASPLEQVNAALRLSPFPITRIVTVSSDAPHAAACGPQDPAGLPERGGADTPPSPPKNCLTHTQRISRRSKGRRCAKPEDAEGPRAWDLDIMLFGDEESLTPTV